MNGIFALLMLVGVVVAAAGVFIYKRKNKIGEVEGVSAKWAGVGLIVGGAALIAVAIITHGAM